MSVWVGEGARVSLLHMRTLTFCCSRQVVVSALSCYEFDLASLGRRRARRGRDVCALVYLHGYVLLLLLLLLLALLFGK